MDSFSPTVALVAGIPKRVGEWKALTLSVPHINGIPGHPDESFPVLPSRSMPIAGKHFINTFPTLDL
jgi:hypothetical protein